MKVGDEVEYIGHGIGIIVKMESMITLLLKDGMHVILPLKFGGLLKPINKTEVEEAI